ncbi:hypothetical protein C1645_739319 [Glomus cerebriforme]|uniref:Ubiquitin-like domain-containing protein n=1 Tax=Glomus cerebriforme TaxID=658196 RepID=A0A397SXL7_9GLOM|nr:hypothetical protein C1645_739319 [Glomus cerebriforme]
MQEIDYSTFDKNFNFIHSNFQHHYTLTNFDSLFMLEGEQFWPSTSKSNELTNNVIKEFITNLIKKLIPPKGKVSHHHKIPQPSSLINSSSRSNQSETFNINKTIQNMNRVNRINNSDQTIQKSLTKYKKLSASKVIKFKVHIYWEHNSFYLNVTVPRDTNLRSFKQSVSQAYGFKLPPNCVVIYHTKKFDNKKDLIRYYGHSDKINAALLEFLFLKGKIRVTNSEEKWKIWMKGWNDEVQVTIFSGSTL